jgi:hypothetical protein
MIISPLRREHFQENSEPITVHFSHKKNTVASCHFTCIANKSKSNSNYIFFHFCSAIGFFSHVNYLCALFKPNTTLAQVVHICRIYKEALNFISSSLRQNAKRYLTFITLFIYWTHLLLVSCLWS